MISITYKVYDYSDGVRISERSFSVPNYRTLRSLLSSVDAACLELELEAKGLHDAEQTGHD